MIAILTQTVNVACTFEKCHLSIFREQHSVRILNTYHFSWNVSLFLTSMHVERIASEFILVFPLLCANDGNRFNSRIQQLQVYTFWIPRIHYLFNKFTKQSQKENLKSNCGQNNTGWGKKNKRALNAHAANCLVCDLCDAHRMKSYCELFVFFPLEILR